MSLISFSTPSDKEVLKKFEKKKKSNISFVGEGTVCQKVNETLYIRTIKVSREKVEVLKNVVYIKKGISWFFKGIENVLSA